MPASIGAAVAGLDHWFVIGGQAIRCLWPYRPSRDVDFGVIDKAGLDELLKKMEERGRVEIIERGEDTVHLRFDGLDVSIFVLGMLAPFVEDQRLNAKGLLATKLHAILDRGARRDFFDLYVLLNGNSWGIAQCLVAIREVYGQPVNEALVLRALTYFDDAEREASLPGEGSGDWSEVKDFFLKRVGDLLIPPSRTLEIQGRKVGVGRRVKKR